MNQKLATRSEKKSLTADHKATFEKKLANLIAEINLSFDNDPKSSVSIGMAKKYVRLRTKMLEQAFEEGEGLDKTELTRTISSWMNQAIVAYWRDRIGRILNKSENEIPDETIFKFCNEVIGDLCGEDNDLKKEIYDIAMSNEKVSVRAKEWLKTLKELTTSNRHLWNK